MNNLLTLFPGFTKFEVLFSSSFHSSFDPKLFHNLCDGKGASVTLITTTDGKTCGGYTSVSWKSSGGEYKKDSTAFLFSLDSPNKYKSARKGHGEVYHHSNSGPNFEDLHLNCSPMNQENGG